MQLATSMCFFVCFCAMIITDHRAQEWDPTKFIWSGRLVIMEKGDTATIRLDDPNSGMCQ